jgi:transcriptional regulator of aromatic amino acid metabolism
MDHWHGNVRDLRDKVAKYRALARMVTDEETQRQIVQLSDELEQQARNIERGK